MNNIIKLLNEYTSNFNNKENLNYQISLSNIETKIHIQQLNLLKRIFGRHKYDLFIHSDFYQNRIKYPFTKSELHQIISHTSDFKQLLINDIDLSDKNLFINYFLIPIINWFINTKYPKLTDLIKQYIIISTEEKQYCILSQLEEYKVNNKSISIISLKKERIHQELESIFLRFEQDGADLLCLINRQYDFINLNSSYQIPMELKRVWQYLSQPYRSSNDFSMLENWLSSHQIKTFSNHYIWSN
ncbi:T3SS regulon anti-activator ExsD family protein [Moellerella wisconsensis]|uniref:Uncharacterized protein n=1 Tax=Moellerella wisconsensis ATCC 35017 TaxID=1354267 RepID=A0A0N0Z849_9GAMM|nr:T3SS regulon anti-activator ExsD family protein [Moellerella wisconsensis]KPD03119.1 hypothetical protein M992_1422 [Moellerella wisconsensis ATCC 35017]VFS48773.1 Uncharacterised protein [Moellerella wisconsensis]